MAREEHIRAMLKELHSDMTDAEFERKKQEILDAIELM